MPALWENVPGDLLQDAINFDQAIRILGRLGRATTCVERVADGNSEDSLSLPGLGSAQGARLQGLAVLASTRSDGGHPRAHVEAFLDAAA